MDLKYSQDRINNKKHLVKLRNNIKQKLLVLKTNLSESDRKFQVTYDPILKPLKTIIDVVKKEKHDVVKKEKHDDDDDVKKELLVKSESESESDTENEQKKDKSVLFNKYIQGLINDKGTLKIYDQIYGFSYNHSKETLSLGKSSVSLDGDSIVLDDHRFPATKGLYELLFLKKPNGYKNEDIINYIKMLKLSRIIYLYNNPTKRIKGNSSLKYRKIIKPYITVEKQGGGLFDSKLRYENKPYRALYWDDPNELVDRLMLLLASQQAGNTTHENEIAAIEEELREAKIIY